MRLHVQYVFVYCVWVLAVSATIDRLQTLSLTSICVTQFTGIVLAAGLTSDNEETDSIMVSR